MFRLSVVVKTEDGYKDYHVDVDVAPEKADAFRMLVAKRGFTAEGKRYFSDQIESLALTELPDAKGTDRQEGGEYQSADR